MHRAQNKANGHIPLKKTSCETRCTQLQTKGQNLKGVIIDRCGIPKAMRSNQTREELKYENSPKLR